MFLDQSQIHLRHPLTVDGGGKASRGLSKLSDRAQSLGQRMKLLYGVIAATGAVRGLQEMVKLYADFKAGLIGVGKTANLSGDQLASLGKDIDALSKRIPVATDELLAIAQSASQLGVKGAANILKFTETVAKLGTATDLSGNDADMATEIARGTAIFGVSSAEATALAAALFFQLVNASYEKGAAILTSNRGFKEWGQIFGDNVVAAALLDRLFHHAVVIHIEGNSYRLGAHQNILPENLAPPRNTAVVP